MSSLSRFVQSPLAPIFLIVFTDVVGLGMAVPVLPLFAKDELGASATQIALLQSVYYAAQFFAAPWLGRWSDRVGRRRVLVFSQLGTLLAMLLTAWAPSLWVVYLARVFDGLTAGNVSVAFAYVGDVSRPEQRARAMGVVNAGFGAGFMFGPALGGVLGGSFGPRVPFLAAACMSAVSIALSYWRLREPDRRTSTRPSAEPGDAVASQPVAPIALRHLPGVKWMFAMGFGMQLAMLTFTSTWVLWADDVLLTGNSAQQTQRLVGYLFAFIGTCGLLTQAFLVGPAVRRFGERKLVMGGMWMRGLGFTLMGAVPRLPVTFASIPLASVGGGLAVPSLMATVTNAVPGHRRGQAMGSMNAAENVGRVIGPVLAGLLFEHVSPAAPIFAAAAVCLLSSLFVLRFGPASDRREPGATLGVEPLAAAPPDAE